MPDGADLAGRSTARLDAHGKVTGSCHFVSDLVTPEMLRIAVHRSAVPHARITAIETADAEACPGVVAVLTGRDLADVDAAYGLAIRDQRIVAGDRVRFVGDGVAIVIGETGAAAADGVSRVHVVYEPLPAVFDLEAALRPEAPRLHPTVTTADTYLDLRDLSPIAGTNIAHRFASQRGDVDAAWAGCAVVVEGTYRFPAVNHAALEPDTVIARWEGDRVGVWASTRHPFQVRSDIARMFHLPAEHVRVIVPPIGGAFGSKAYTRIEPLVVAAARRMAGRAVAYSLAPDEEFIVKRRLPAICSARTGFAADGTLVVHDAQLRFDIGAYAGHGPRIAQKAGYTALGPYRVPHARIESLAVYTNNVPGSAFRGYGVPQAAWAMEGQMDRAAAALGLSAVQIRERNLLRRGEVVQADDLPADGEFQDDLRTLVTAYSRAAGRRPAGVACALKASNPATISEARVRLGHDGRVDLVTAASEFGQGAWTVLAQIVATELGVPIEAVRVREPDTAEAPYDQGTGSSRTTTVMGLAVQTAARTLRAGLAQRLAAVAGATPATLRIDGSHVVTPDGRIPLATLGDEPLCASGQARGGQVGRGALGGTVPFWELGMAAAEVDFDADTGAVSVPRYYTLADVGYPINPQQCESQEFGAAVMGLGHTLREEVVSDAGAVVTAGLIHYPLPRFDNMPEDLVSILVANRDGSGPYGSKGLGESGLLATAAAVSSALFHAFGLDLRELPLTPERVWRAARRARAEMEQRRAAAR